MRKQFLLLSVGTMALGLLSLTACPGGPKPDKYTKDGKLIVPMRNLYFSSYKGGDSYIQWIEDEFQMKFQFETYDWANWGTQVTGSINNQNMEDVFHANIDSYNFANTYKFWASEELIKPLPADMSKWPNIQTVLDNTSNIDSLKINGRLYGIPIAKNTTDYSTSFSPFTYIYRRDWAKKWGVYQENDVYTWAQFEALLNKFKTELKPYNKYALADVEWGFPSIPNFYKQVPHCYAQDNTGAYVCNYTTDAYIAGLNESKSFMSNGWYHPDQSTALDGTMNEKYYGNQVGVLYENLSYSNYIALKNNLRKTNVDTPNFQIDDAIAIMKIKGENDMYSLEGTDNWFSMTLFDNRITDNKQEKVLDVLNWLLGEEGTRFSVYGFEHYDYEIVDGVVKIKEEAWPKDLDTGEYAPKDNGASYLRNLISLGYDTLEMNPLSDQDAVEYLNAWDAEMKAALAENKLRVLKETSEVMWLATEKKARYSSTLRETALKDVMKYVYNNTHKTVADFKKQFDNKTWKDVLKEINNALGH